MIPLEQGIGHLQNNELLTGKVVAGSEFLKIWIHQHHNAYDLYVTCALGPSRAKAGTYRNTIGKGFTSADELLEAIEFLDSIYHIDTQELLEAPSFIRLATPELLQLLEQHLARITHSTRTGEFTPDDLRASIVKLDPEEPDQTEETPPEILDDEEELVVVTDRTRHSPLT